MGVYIDMEMPQSCDDCRLNNGISCYAVPEYTEDGVVGRTEDRPDWCPLFSVPPHGRLIDADAVEKQIEYVANLDWNKKVGASGGMLAALEIVEDAPTILEAEEGE